MNIRHVGFIELIDSSLLAEYAAECSIPEIGSINPQAQTYAQLEQAGIMQCFGVFRGDQLIGFASLLVTVLPHYGQKVATLESLFVGKKYRNGNAGGKLMDAVEAYAKEAGCKAILYSAPSGGKLEKLLSRLKRMRKTNSVFCRQL